MRKTAQALATSKELGEFIKPLHARAPIAAHCEPTDLAQGHLVSVDASHDEPGYPIRSLLHEGSFRVGSNGWAAKVSNDELRKVSLFFDVAMIKRVTLGSGSATGGHLAGGSLWYTTDRGFLTVASARWKVSMSVLYSVVLLPNRCMD